MQIEDVMCGFVFARSIRMIIYFPYGFLMRELHIEARIFFYVLNCD